MKLRATKHDGGATIIRMLDTINLADLATQSGIRKARLIELATGDEKVKPATDEELIAICSGISGGLLRYIIDGDAIVTDAAMAIRMALIGRDVARIVNDAAIPSDFLERYRDGSDVLTADELDTLAALLFDGRMKIERETGELVAVGYTAPPVMERQTRRVPYPSQPTRHSHINQLVSLDSKGLAPVAVGAASPSIAVLHPEPPRAGYLRFEMKLKAIVGGS